MRRQLDDSEAVQRAQITIEDFSVQDLDSNPKGTYRVVNRGQTAALDIAVGMAGGGGVVGNGSSIEPSASVLDFNIAQIRKGELGPGFNLAAGQGRLFTFPVSPDLRGGKKTEFHQVYVAYTDIFHGKMRITADCIFYDVDNQRFTPCASGHTHD
jgi:hypothetical protein